LFAFLTLLAGCPKHVVRNAEVYRAEIAWNTAAFERTAEVLERGALERLAKGDRAGCLEFAESALVLSIRGPWHSAMALHLADLGEDPGDLPEVPPAESLCPEPEPTEVEIEGVE